MAINQLGSSGAAAPVTLVRSTIQCMTVSSKTIDGKPSSQQKCNSAKVPLWKLNCLVQTDEEVAFMSVTVPSAIKPAVNGPIQFDGLRVGFWHSDTGNKGGLYWVADGVHAADATSTTRRGGVMQDDRQ